LTHAFVFITQGDQLPGEPVLLGKIHGWVGQFHSLMKLNYWASQYLLMHEIKVI